MNLKSKVKIKFIHLFLKKFQYNNNYIILYVNIYKMSNEEKNKIEEDAILEQMEEEINEVENSEGEIDEEKLDEVIHPEIDENSALAKVMADFDNFKKRTDRDRTEMIFFLKQDIFKKILPRLDDLDRIIKNTPAELKENALFEGVISMQSKLIEDLNKMWVIQFDSKWEEVNPNMHDVMTTVPGQKEWIIFDEFEKGYMLWDKVLRHAKVVVGAWE